MLLLPIILRVFLLFLLLLGRLPPPLARPPSATAWPAGGARGGALGGMVLHFLWQCLAVGGALGWPPPPAAMRLRLLTLLAVFPWRLKR